jgi:uncharacterized protein DUF3515
VLSCLGVVAALALAGCSEDPVTVATTDLDGADRAACQAFLDALPDELADESDREVEPGDALAAAYGDPPIVITCVDTAPEGFDEVAECQEVNDVGWYVPDEQVADPSADATLTAMSHSPFVQVEIPADYRPDGAAAVLAELSKPISDHLELVDDCL